MRPTELEILTRIIFRLFGESRKLLSCEAISYTALRATDLTKIQSLTFERISNRLNNVQISSLPHFVKHNKHNNTGKCYCYS